jgi:hypothetical protein
LVGVVEAAALEFHPFLADRFAEAIVPAAAVLVVEHDARPLQRLLERIANPDAKWLSAARVEAAIKAAEAAVKNLPVGTVPDELIAAHELVYDPHTGRDAVMNPPAWALALNEVAAAFCICTRKTPGWNGAVMAQTDDGETLDKFVAAAKEFSPDAHKWYGKLAGGMVAWMQGGPVRGWLTRGEVPLLRKALEADQVAMFRWKERGGDFHRRKIQAFCFLAEKHGVGLAAVVKP